MLAQIICFLSIYFIFLLHGFWLYAVCVSEEKSDLPLLLIVSPILGVCLICLYYTYIINLSIRFSVAQIPFEILTVVGTIAALKQRWTSLKKEGLAFYAARRETIHLTACATAMLGLTALGLLGPILGRLLTTPWRIGPDSGGYTTCATFLFRDNTLKTLDGKFTHPIEIYTYEFFVQGYRRGYAGMVAAVSKLLHLHPAQLIFTLTAVLLFLCLLVALRLAQNGLREMHPLLPFWIMTAVGFNCNLLFVFYEGSYLQIASMPLILMVILWQLDGVPLRDALVRRILFDGILLASMTAIYPEAMIITPMLVVGYFVADRIARRQLDIQIKQIGVALGAMLLAYGLNWYVLAHWFRIERENSALLSLAGWAQPQWAYLPEIMGWINIYRHVIGNSPDVLNPVMGWVSQASLTISFLLGALILISVFWGRRISSLAAVPGFMILAAYRYFLYIRMVHSYSYMKIYTLVLPLFAVGCLGSLLSSGRFKRSTGLGVICLSLLTVFNGVSFIRTYRSDYAYLSAGLLELKDIEKTVDLSPYVLFYRPDDTDEHVRIRCIFIHTLLSAKLIHGSYFAHQDFSESRRSPVALLLHDPNHRLIFSPADVLWRGSEYVIVNTHIPVEDAWSEKSRIPWKPEPPHPVRPELEVLWLSMDSQAHIYRYYSFSKFLDKAKGQGI